MKTIRGKMMVKRVAVAGRGVAGPLPGSGCGNANESVAGERIAVISGVMNDR